MSVVNSSPGSSNYQTAWREALKHLDNLSPKQQKIFDRLEPSKQTAFRRTAGPDEIVQVLQQTGSSTRSISRFVKFTEAVVQPFSRFTSAVISAANGFTKIDAWLEDTLDKLIRFDEYEKHFQSSLDLMHDALTKFYVDVIDLALVTTNHFRRGVFRSISRVVVRGFDDDFGEVMLSMKRHVDAIDPAAMLGGLIEAKKHHQDVSARLGELKVGDAVNRLAERELAVRRWLSRTDVNIEQHKHQRDHLQGTCGWFFQEPSFCDWRDSASSSRFWVRGIAGCGKSVLSSVLIDHLKSCGKTVVYFFCKQGDENRENPLSILRTLLWQFLDHPSAHENAFADLIHRVMVRSGTTCADSILDLWVPLGEIIGMLPATYCVIDGLDECNKDDGLVDFLAKLTKFSGSNSTGTVFKTFATCRPNQPHIEGQLNATWSSFVIEKANVQGDIDKFISHRIQSSEALSHDIHRDKVYSSVIQGAGGMFLWARLMLDDLDGTSFSEIEEVLAGMPDGLGAVYDLMLQRVSQLKPRSIERCRKILHWSAIARQPLLVDELLLALAVSEGLSSHGDYDLGLRRNFELQLIKEACGSLVTILGDGTVQLVHTSLREHLLKETSPNPLDRGGAELSTDPDQAHTSLGMACLKYNMLSCFQDDITTENIETPYPFLRYSTSNWIHHVSLSGSHYGEFPSMITKFFESSQGWQWLNRCCLFGITSGHLLLLQGDLKTWISGASSQDETSAISGFILNLSKRRYEASKLQYTEKDRRTMHAAYRVGYFFGSQGWYEEALEWYGRALAGYEEALGKEHPSTMEIVNNMGLIYYNQGQHEEALEWFGRAQAGNENVLGGKHPSTLRTVSNIALVYDSQGRYEEALELCGRALAGYEKARGKEYPSTMDMASNMALIYYNQGLCEEALEWHGRALAGYEKALGGKHPSTLRTVNGIALVYNSQGRYEEALELYERVLAGLEKTLGKEHSSTMDTVNSMAIVYSSQGRYEEALELYGRALAGYEKALGKGHPSTMNTANNMAIVYSSQGRYEEALEWYGRALAGYEKALGKEHASTLRTVNSIALVYYNQGQHEEALEWFGRVLAGHENALGGKHPSTLGTINNITLVYDSQGRYEEALELYGRALAGYEKSLGKEHPSTMNTANSMAICQEMLEHAGRNREDSLGVARIDAAHGEKSEAPPREY